MVKATPNTEVSEEMARLVGLPPLPVAPEELPVLEGPVPVEVLVPLERTEETPEPDREGDELSVGRAA